MKVAIIYNKDLTGVINRFGMQNKEVYNPETVRKVADALEKGGHNVRIAEGDMYVVERLKEFMPSVIEGERMGMVFNMAYGIQGEGRYTHLPAMLEMLGIPYVGSGPEGHSLALDKVITKIIMQKQGVLTPNFWVYSTGDEGMSDVEYPVIVKPKMEAVSYGIRIAENETELREAVKFVISEFKQQALVEQFIRGREFCVGLLGNGDPEAFPVLEIDLEGDPDAIQTVDDKKQKPRGKICPAEISSELADAMVRMSKDAFRALGLRDFARVDIRMDEDENIYLLEINSMASLGVTGSFVHAAGVAGYDYTRLANRIVDVAAVRYFSEKILPGEALTETGGKKLPLPIRIRGFLRTKQEDTERLLERMVNINSYVRNVDGVNSLGTLVWQQLSPIGFSHQVIPMVEVGNILLLSNSTDNNYDVLLLSHLDNSTPFTRQIRYRKTEQKIYGTAVWDSNGGLAVMIAALRALRFARLLRKMKVGVLLTTDNTRYGRVTRNHIQEILQRAGVVLGLSGASLDGTVITSRSGVAVYNCQMNLLDAVDAGDVARATASFSRLLASLTKLSSEVDGAVVIPRKVKMSAGIAILHANCEAQLSVRFDNQEQGEALDRKIHSLVTKMNSKKNRFQIEGGICRPPMVRNRETENIYQRVRAISNRLDIRTIEEHGWSSSAICAVRQDRARIDGLGPIGDVPHDYEEYILRHSLLDRAALLALLMNDLRPGK
ncbi:MAG: D-alanine--D-alanine ligase [Candidatus Methanogaster sp.]|nr:MAG: D-alanine--D-alanine ligase [ANME-2 cluster archaeon]